MSHNRMEFCGKVLSFDGNMITSFISIILFNYEKVDPILEIKI